MNHGIRLESFYPKRNHIKRKIGEPIVLVSKVPDGILYMVRMGC